MKRFKKLVILGLFGFAVVGAQAQTFFHDSFEPPTYTAGQSANGTYGWQTASYRGINQVVSADQASSGAQSLFFTNGSTDFSQNGLINGLPLGLTADITISTEVFLGANNDNGRIAELLFAADSVGYAGHDRLSLDGSGAIRYGSDTGGFNDPLGSVAGYASSGSYLGRWLKFSMTHHMSSGLMDWRISGFGIGQADIAGSFNGFAGGGYVEISSRANNQAPNAGGQVYFDDVNVAAVPEPSSLAVIGLGLLGLVTRQRVRSAARLCSAPGK